MRVFPGTIDVSVILNWERKRCFVWQRSQIPLSGFMQAKVSDSKDAIKVSPAKRLSCHCSAQILYIETVNSCLHSVYICLQIMNNCNYHCQLYKIFYRRNVRICQFSHFQSSCPEQILKKTDSTGNFLGHLSKLDIILSIRSEINCVQMNSTVISQP